MNSRPKYNHSLVRAYLELLEKTLIAISDQIVGRHLGACWNLPGTGPGRVVFRWNCAKVIANIDDLAITIWALKVIDELSQIDDI